MNALRILLIEDEARLADSVKQGLVEDGFAVEIAGSAEAAEPIIAHGALDLIVLDIGLPGKSGLELLREMRAAGNQTPVLILTARGTLEERVAGLDSGSDDYLAKPFAFAELVARIKALARRPRTPASPILKVGDLEFDTVKRRAKIGEHNLNLVAERKDAARIADAQRRAGGDARHDRGDGVGLELQLADQPDRSVRQSAAAEDRSARRPFADSHRAGSRIHDARGMIAAHDARSPPMTIRLRLTIYWATVLAAILLVAAIAAIKLFERQQFSALDAALLEEAENAADQIQRGGTASALGILQRLSLETDIGPGRRVRIVTAHSEVGNFGDVHTIPPPFDPSLPTHPAIVGNRAFRFAVVPMLYNGEIAYLQSGVQAGLVEESVSGLRNLLLLMVPIVLMLCVGGGYLLAGRALRPIESVTAELDAIGPTNLSSRLTVPPVADEVARLTAEINSLLERLERASATERRFASDAAHELRTPLAVLRTGLEVALARDRTPDGKSRCAGRGASRGAVAVQDCRRTADAVAAQRRSDGRSAEAESSRAAERDSGDGRAAGAIARDKAYGQRARGRFRQRQQGHLRRLIVNLLDNALKFTPAGGSIDVGLKSDANRAITSRRRYRRGNPSGGAAAYFRSIFSRRRIARRRQRAGLEPMPRNCASAWRRDRSRESSVGRIARSS